MANPVSHTLLLEAQQTLKVGYKGLRDDLSIALGWPISRLGSIAKGRVSSGLRYGSKNAQVQAVIVLGQKLAGARVANELPVVVAMPLEHLWRLTPLVQDKIRLPGHDDTPESPYNRQVRIPAHVARVMGWTPVGAN